MKRLIIETFPEASQMALAVANCESSYKMIQSHHIQPYGRELSWGVFQIHDPAWKARAEQLGLDYRNSVRDNIKMARYIYDKHGWSPWSCTKMLAMR